MGQNTSLSAPKPYPQKRITTELEQIDKKKVKN